MSLRAKTCSRWRRPRRSIGALALFVGCVLPWPALATAWQLIGARYQGMGGAGVAVVDDSLALYWNPGALAFAKGRDLRLPVGFSVSAEGNVMSEIDSLDGFARDLRTIRNKIENGEPLTPSERSTVLQLVGRDIPLFREDDEAFLPRANVGLTGRSGRFAFGLMGDGNSVIAPFQDDGRLGLSAQATPALRVADIVGVGADRSAELTPAGQRLADAIADEFRAFTNTGLEQDQAEEFVFQAEQAGLDTSAGEVGEGLRLAARQTAASNGSLLSSNLTGAAAVTLVTAETALAYGHPIHDVIGVGGAIRYVYGNTFVDYTTFYDIDSVRELINETLEFNNRQDGHEVAIDLGLLVRPVEWLRIGVVARNLNEPDFKVDLPAAFRSRLRAAGIEFDRFKLGRQVRAGIAVDVLPWWTLAADLDLTENDVQYVPGLNSRLLSLGTEVRAGWQRVALAMRGGLLMNLGSDQNQAPTLTAGVGLRLWNFTFDLSGGVSTEQDRFESIGTDDRIPVRVDFAMQLGYRVAF